MNRPGCTAGAARRRGSQARQVPDVEVMRRGHRRRALSGPYWPARSPWWWCWPPWSPCRGSWPGPGPGRPHRHHGPHAQYGFYQRLEDLHRRGRQPPLPLPPDLADQGTPGRRRGAGLHDPGAAGVAVPAMPPAAFQVSWQVSRSFWIGENWVGGPPARAASRTAGRTCARSPTPPAMHFAGWSIDWGRPCLTGAARCVPHSVGSRSATDGRLWDRYRAVAETIPATVEQLRPTAPTVGDRGLPACRADQWRLVWVEEWGVTEGYQGSSSRAACSTARGLATAAHPAPGGGRRRGSAAAGQERPASTAVEGDLPVDGLQRLSAGRGSSAAR